MVKIPNGWKEVFPEHPMCWVINENRQIIFQNGAGHCLEKEFSEAEKENE